MVTFSSEIPRVKWLESKYKNVSKNKTDLFKVSNKPLENFFNYNSVNQREFNAV